MTGPANSWSEQVDPGRPFEDASQKMVRVTMEAKVKRKLVVDSADYWFHCARGPQYSQAERHLFWENAVNHLEGALVAARKELGLDAYGKPHSPACGDRGVT